MTDTIVSSLLITDSFKQPPSIVGIVGARVGFPLQFQQAKSYTGPRVALIGDAAHSIHPQAGQGLNLGLEDANELGTIITTNTITITTNITIIIIIISYYCSTCTIYW